MFIRRPLGSRECPQKYAHCGHSHVKAEHLQDEVLHAEDVLHFVGVVCDVGKLRDLGGVDLLVLPVNIRVENLNTY